MPFVGKTTWRSAGIFVFLAVTFSGVGKNVAYGEGNVDFSRDIRPLLSDRCFSCHGPDENNREADLRLDAEESAKEYAIVPGEPDDSEVMVRITSDDESERMPPDADKTLTPAEIEKVRQWIAAGAPWQRHWSLVAPERPQLPKVQDEAWPRNPIDRFTLAQMESEGLAPSPEASAETLLRRVTFDLTGLPPTPAEVDAFLADKSQNAYEKAVDRLLRSPRYGEHMARFWLDGARYGDTHGLHLDNYREMWPYRDWVIRAFNNNLPYDQFTIEQLAGDLLPGHTRDQLIATGFNRAHVTTNEGGSIKEEVYVRNVVDRVVTTGTVFMGMTFECTRCHDHKFDPFTMHDFYSMFAFFNSIDGEPMDGNRKDHAPVIRVPTDDQEKQLADYDRQIAALETRLRGPWPEVDQLQAEWEKELASAGNPQETEEDSAEKVSDQVALGDWYTVGPFAENRRYLYRRKHGPEGNPVDLAESFQLATGETVKWIRRAEWTDGKPHQDLPGQFAANFLYRSLTVAKAQKLSASFGSDDAIKVYLNGKQVLGKDVQRGVAPDQDTVDLPLKAGENPLMIKIMNYGGASGFYFAMQSVQDAVPDEIRRLAALPQRERSAKQGERLREHFRNRVATSPELEQARGKLARSRSTRADLDRQIPTTLVWRERKESRPAYLLKRGEYDRRGDVVARRTPGALPPMAENLPVDRLGFAKWLVSRSHPLTARVAVNRFWQQTFGVGIAKTAEDFGSQGEPPSHPKLLDWLAVEFIEGGWDIRATNRRIVTSATYRQSSSASPERYRHDPANRLLTRGPRFRLDAEMLRDQALFVSDLLVERIGGPSVKPPQPDGLWFAVGYSGSNTVRFAADQGNDKVHRRTIYTFIKRTAPPPQMSIIDAPSRESCVVRRERTNTPLQALLLFNDPQFVETARALAERTLREGGEKASSRAEYMFRLCVCRRPTTEELADLVQGIGEELTNYQADLESARKLAAVGETPRDEKLDVSEVAAWTMMANLLLNLDEVITKN